MVSRIPHLELLFRHFEIEVNDLFGVGRHLQRPYAAAPGERLGYLDRESAFTAACVAKKYRQLALEPEFAKKGTRYRLSPGLPQPFVGRFDLKSAIGVIVGS